LNGRIRIDKYNTMPTHKVTNEVIMAAIAGFESQKQGIDAQIAELRQMLDGGRPEPTAVPETAKPARKKMSAAARRKIAAAQRKRWAKSKQQSEPTQPTAAAKPIKPKRKISAAGKRAIVAATKARWAAFRAAKAATAKQAPAAKKAGKKSPVKASRKAAKEAAAKPAQTASASA
jgi:hypothetical protein